ncbi:hypothetical protein F0225_02960 [Vibrio pectenicida]|uniref:UDP-glycosyltransferase n=1 Tax=Vibrio pectenicida TaxID=62763 RepID=A0A7Y3ZWB9_9VIBR|nr:hypothetical protein [Vibrio pectenicida]NOH70301.1 hypothetical protein [Vibrio pectenicida]
MTIKRVLCVSYGGGHAAMLTPVIKELEKNANIEVIILGLTTAKSYFSSRGVESLGFKDFTFLADNTYREIGESLIDGTESSNLVSREESLAYMGINMLELIDTYGTEDAHQNFINRGRQAFLPVNFFTKVIKHLDVDLVIATNSPRSEQAAILAARNLHVKSICLVDLFALQEYLWIKDDMYADKVCVLNKEVKRFLISHDRCDEHIVVTGNPAFDIINRKEKIEGGRAIRSKLNTDKIVIFYASQVEPAKHPYADLKGDPMLPRDIEATLRKFVRENENYQLIVRYHPSENVTFVKEDRIEYGGGDLHSILHAVDIVVVMSSTVGLEAYLAGKPVISIDLSVFSPDAPYSEMGISRGVKSLDTLKDAIYDTRMSNESDRKQTDALDKVIQEINSLLF